MSNKIVLIDLFSGIGGFAKGLHDAGFEITDHYFSEIDAHAIANYRYNFKHAQYVGSILDFSATRIRKQHPNAHIIVTFGWPCQDNSIAGKRKGQRADTRSGLLFEAGRIIREVMPQHFIAENVKGLYSVSSGEDFYQAVEFLSYLDTDCPQYTLESQLFNTSWVLPQNRERIYFVGHLGAASIKRVFPIGESNCRSDEGLSKTTNIRTLTVGGKSGGHHSGMTLIKQVIDKKTLAMTPNSYDTSGMMDCLSSSLTDTKANIITRPHGYNKGNEVGISPTITSRSFKDNNFVKQLNPSIESNGVQPFQQNRYYDTDGIAPNLCQDKRHFKIQVKAVLTPDRADEVPFITNPKMNNYEKNYNCSVAITASSYKEPPVVNNIRRLTEIECERLQGFDDFWTKYGVYESKVWINKKEKTFEIVEGIREIPKTQRYKLCGNAVTKNIVEMVGKRLLENSFDT